MKVVKKKEAKRHKNSDVCVAVEYPLGDKDINCAVVELSGKYPDKGRVVNEECKELVHIIEGKGELVIEGKRVGLSEGDQVLIEPGERYYWDGKMTFFVSCTPTWYPEQHKEVE